MHPVVAVSRGSPRACSEVILLPANESHSVAHVHLQCVVEHQAGFGRREMRTILIDAKSRFEEVVRNEVMLKSGLLQCVKRSG